MGTTAPSQKRGESKQANFHRNRGLIHLAKHLPGVTPLKHVSRSTCAEPPWAPCMVRKEKRALAEGNSSHGMEGVRLISPYVPLVLSSNSNGNLQISVVGWIPLLEPTAASTRQKWQDWTLILLYQEHCSLSITSLLKSHVFTKRCHTS